MRKQVGCRRRQRYPHWPPPRAAPGHLLWAHTLADPRRNPGRTLQLKISENPTRIRVHFSNVLDRSPLPDTQMAQISQKPSKPVFPKAQMAAHYPPLHSGHKPWQALPTAQMAAYTLSPWASVHTVHPGLLQALHWQHINREEHSTVPSDGYPRWLQLSLYEPPPRFTKWPHHAGRAGNHCLIRSGLKHQEPEEMNI